MYWTPFFHNSASASSPARVRTIRALALALLLFCTARSSAGVSTRPATGDDERILSAVPRDALAVYCCRPDPSDQAFGQGLSRLINVAGLLGVFGRDQQILADTIAVVLELCKYPHAAVLMDVTSERLGEGSFALGSFSAALIVDCGDRHGRLLALLKQIVDHYFTQGNAVITWAGSGADRRQKLTAANLPEWCVWQWGRRDGLFVFTVGPNAYDRIAGRINTTTAPSGGDGVSSNLIVTVANRLDRDLEHRLWLIYFDVDGLDRKLRPALGDYYDQIVDALQLSSPEGDRAEKVVFSAGFSGRAFISKLYTRSPIGIRLRYLTRAIDSNDQLTQIIPPRATSYALAEADVGATIAWATAGYLACRNPGWREQTVRHYHAAVKRAGLSDVYAELFDHLKPRLLIHDWPAHPLNWPSAKTILIEHDGTDQAKQNFHRFLTVWQTLLDMLNSPTQNDAKQKTWADTLFEFRLHRTNDDIWFLHVGPVILVAAAVSDHYLLLSWSPPAVRVNLVHLNRIRTTASKPTTQTRPTRPR